MQVKLSLLEGQLAASAESARRRMEEQLHTFRGEAATARLERFEELERAYAPQPACSRGAVLCAGQRRRDSCWRGSGEHGTAAAVGRESNAAQCFASRTLGHKLLFVCFFSNCVMHALLPAVQDDAHQVC